MNSKIFVLEDDDAILEVTKLILESEGFEVTGFSTVADFNQEKTLPDLYLLDIMLPDGNGMAVCESLKQGAETGDIPVILMSAHIDLAKRKESSGADSFIAKPFDVYALIDIITGLLKQPT
ncbi:response regulator transcription factor [Pedobacter aquatilis]|uniref:response regulator transcription factor n=1 Tax=Pedobacter aquatilis TaxID=351343 RepID=UPI002930DC92|nr:response regulator [Pedobacter aquatilis]